MGSTELLITKSSPLISSIVTRETIYSMELEKRGHGMFNHAR
jgi:hypothetical protein